MPVFELRDSNGETYEINAPDEKTAVKAFKQSVGNISQAELFEPQHQARGRVASERPDLYGQGERSIMQGIDDRVRSTASGVPLVGGWADEAAAGLNTGFGYLGNYDQELAYQR